MSDVIPYGCQDITDSDIQAVVDVLRSPYLTQGPAVPEFEKSVLNQCKARYAVAANSATSALHIACLALGLSKGDRFWTVPNTFVASANCGLYCGAEVDFVDIDPVTWNMSIACLEEKLIRARRNGKLPKVVIPVHFAGQPTEQEKIWKLGQEFGFKILEDASHSIGAYRHGEPVGSCRWSDISVFSFHPVKIVTAGEGGMATTNDSEIALRMQLLRTHGITRDPSLLHEKNPAPWYYEQQILGFNYRMSDIHASLGRSQMERIGEFVAQRNFLANRYRQELIKLPLQLPTVLTENCSAFHIFPIRLKGDAKSKTHRQVFDGLREKGIGVNLHYMPVYVQPFYRNFGYKKGACPEAEKYSEEAVTLPLFSKMTDAQQNRVISVIKEVL